MSEKKRKALVDEIRMLMETGQQENVAPVALALALIVDELRRIRAALDDIRESVDR